MKQKLQGEKKKIIKIEKEPAPMDNRRISIKYRYRIEMAFFFCLLLLFSGCGKEIETPSLGYRHISVIQMPPVGRKIPTPRAICTDPADNLLVIDDAGRLLTFDNSGKVIKQWSMPETALGHPEGIIVLHDGRIAVTDTHYSRIVIFKPNGKVDKIFGKKSTAKGDLGSPVGIAEDSEGNLYICEYGFTDRVQKFDKNGNFIIAIGSAGMSPNQFQRPSGIVYDNGKIYVADAVNNRIQVFNDKGEHLNAITVKPSFYLPYDIKLGKDGFLYVVEYGNNCITKLTIDGKLKGRLGMNPGDRLHLNSPWGIAVDSKGIVYIADTGNRRIVKCSL